MASPRVEAEVRLAQAEIALDEKADTWSRLKGMGAAEPTLLAAHRNMLKAARVYAEAFEVMVKE